MSAFTQKVWPLHKAPKKLQLFGDATKKVESSTHAIEFPGGAVEISRTTDGKYWVHVIVNRTQVVDDTEGMASSLGQIVGSRITLNVDAGRDVAGVYDIHNAEHIEQFALLIQPVKGN